MANELQFDLGDSGITVLYAVVRNATGQYRRTDTNVWEAFNATNWAANGYRVTVTEQGSSGTYFASLPSGVAVSDGIAAHLYSRLGSNDAPTDLHEGSAVPIDRTGYALSAAGVTAVQSGLSTLTAAQVNAEADAALADVGLTTTVTGRIDASISSVAASAATAVWASGTRTLTSFGTLVADIWSYVTRTITGSTGTQITVINPLVGTTLNLFEKSDYNNTDGTAITITQNAGEPWPTSLSGWTAAFTANINDTAQTSFAATFAGTVTIATETGTKVLRLEFTKAQLGVGGTALHLGTGTYDYTIEATHTSSGRVCVLRSGTVNVKDREGA